MAIQYYSNPNTKETFAVLRGTELDAINKIDTIINNTVIISPQYLVILTYLINKCNYLGSII